MCKKKTEKRTNKKRTKQTASFWCLASTVSTFKNKANNKQTKQQQKPNENIYNI